MIELFLLAQAGDIPEYKVPAVYREYERCVAERESNDRPDAVNPTGKYRGMYQFDDALADGTTWHIVDWLGTWHSKPRAYAKALRDTPMNKWPRQVQVAAFVSVLDGHDQGVVWAGKQHFAGGRWKC